MSGQLFSHELRSVRKGDPSGTLLIRSYWQWRFVKKKNKGDDDKRGNEEENVIPQYNGVFLLHFVGAISLAINPIYT